MVKLAIVSPCYNEEEALPETARQLALKYGQLLSSGMIGEGNAIAAETFVLAEKV